MADNFIQTARPARTFPPGWRDLAPRICRQRHIVEFLPAGPVTDVQIRGYLRRLGDVLDMTVLADPVTHLSEKFGWSGWVHWSTSGAHFYAWESPLLFASVDIYTCKPFDGDTATEFTAGYFGARAVVGRPF